MECFAFTKLLETTRNVEVIFTSLPRPALASALEIGLWPKALMGFERDNIGGCHI